jgi:hypothetical protein
VEDMDEIISGINIARLPSASGRSEFIKFFKGDRITLSESILAKCYECTGHYQDGREDCGCDICPLHPYMPYNPNKLKFRAT